MPYIAQDLRTRIDGHIDEIVRILRQFHRASDRGSHTAEVILALVAHVMQPATGWRYHWLHRAFGVFAAAYEEASRRLPYVLAADFIFQPQVIEPYWDRIVNIADQIKAQEHDGWDGYLNYAVSMIAGRTMDGHCLPYLFELFCIAGEEFYARYAGPYEDGAIAKNGDIEPYAHP